MIFDVRRKYRGFAALFALSLAFGCQAQLQSRILRDEPAPGSALTPDQQARRKAYIENHIATRLALLNAPEGRIRNVLEQCRSAIHARAIRDDAGRSQVRLIDGSTSGQAARLAYAAGASVDSIDERWNRFAKVPDRKTFRGKLDLVWAAGFGGPGGAPPTRAARYECKVDRHLVVSVRPQRDSTINGVRAR